jgi:co-chaperonin GroES (HSP10)
MIENFRPTQGFVLVKLVKEEEKTSGGLYIPKSNDKSNLLKGIPLVGLDSNDGSTIKYAYFPKLVGFHLDEDHLVIPFKDILGCDI